MIQVTSEYLRHVLILHTAESDAIPGQFAPFVEGAGLSHRRVLVLRPPPHVLVHRLKLLQGPQSPFTTSDIKKCIQTSMKIETKYN